MQLPREVAVKRSVTGLLIIAVLSISLSGCFGKFGLTRKVYQANSEVQDKIGRSLVTWAFVIIPVYGVAALLDFAIFNTIEFWSGRNPSARGDKDFEYARDGKKFKIHAEKHDDTIVYTFERFDGTRYTDLQTIEWDMASGNFRPLVEPAASHPVLLAFN